MVRIAGTTICFIVLLCFVGCSEQRSDDYGVEVVEPTTTPQPVLGNKFVADEKAAIEIAVNAWVPIYGKQQIDEEKPYHAILKNGIWTVEGSLPEGWVGGVAMAQISQKDGRILKIIHGK